MSEVQDIQRFSRRIQAASHSLWKPNGESAKPSESQTERLQSKKSQPLHSLASPPPNLPRPSRQKLPAVQHMRLHEKGGHCKPPDDRRDLTGARDVLNIIPGRQQQHHQGHMPRAAGRMHAKGSGLAYHTQSSLSRDSGMRLHSTEQEQHSSKQAKSAAGDAGNGSAQDMGLNLMPTPQGVWTANIGTHVHQQQQHPR